MKIIRTPIDWDSNPDDNWLHSEDYQNKGIADIKVDENYSLARTGTVTFIQDESGNQEEVTVVQKRTTTFYYPLGTNYRPSASFNIGGVSVASVNGVAVRECGPNEEAPEEMIATPETDIKNLTVSKPSITFPATGGTINETFTWVDWDKTGVTLHRSADTVPQEYINSASTSVTTVNSVSGPDWLTLTRNGEITASENTSTDQRSGTVEYTYCGRTATVQVTQEATPPPPPPSDMYFGVKTKSSLAQGQPVTFTISGGDSTQTEVVDFSNTQIQGYYVAYVSASSENSVSASCNISDYSILTDESKLTFNSTGGTKIVHVHPQKVQLQLENQNLTGCSSPSNDGFYTINAETDENQPYLSAIMSGEGFSINGNSITASANETDSSRSGTAEFTLTEVTGVSALVGLEQGHVNSFTFKSTVSGSPKTAKVAFYDKNAQSPFTTITYTTIDDTQSVNEKFYRETDYIRYEILSGFTGYGSITASTDYAEFSPIEMVFSGDKYTLSNVKKEVGVTAEGVSYTYEKKVNGQNVTYQNYQDYLSGAINPSDEVEVNATATTENQFTISATYNPVGTFANWSYTTDNTTKVTVRTKASIPVSSAKTLTLTYALEWEPTVSAKTNFFLPSSATNNIELQNFALSSHTQFGSACTATGIPTGSNAFTFAFWPSGRYPMGAASGLGNVKVAEMRYKSEGTPKGWMLFYPYTPTDGQVGVSASSFANYTAKIYALSYRNVEPNMTGKDDVWTLGPLMYRLPDDPNYPNYTEVEDFEFLSGNTRISVCDTSAVTSTTISSDKPYYPSVCPFNPRLSGSSNYFQLSDVVHGIGSASTGTISSDKKKWSITGHAVGGLYSNSSPGNFITRTYKMIYRNQKYHYYDGVDGCDDSDLHSKSPNMMAHALDGTLLTNLLGTIQVKVIYHGNIDGYDDSAPAYIMPASTYIVTPTTPGDTTSVVYDAETNSYLIYDIENVVILHKQDYTVVPEMEYSGFTRLTEAEIIGPVEP